MYYRDIRNLRMSEPMSGFPTEIIKISIQKIEAKIGTYLHVQSVVLISFFLQNLALYVKVLITRG